MTPDDFREEMTKATRAYDRYVVNLEKPTDDFERALESLVTKAIRAYESRGPNMRHGIALDKHVTVILSQADTPRPLCGIYFNLHSPYAKRLPKTPQSLDAHPQQPPHDA